LKTVFRENFKKKITGFGLLLVFLIFIVMGLGAFKVVAKTQETKTLPDSVASAQQKAPAKTTDSGVVKFAFLAASIAVGVGSLGAGAAVGYVGAAAMGAIGEKPELAGRALIFVGLAEGIAIYGLIIAIMILGKV